MPWTRVRPLLWWLATLLLCMAPRVHAQGIESVLSPGRLAQAHAKLEDQCAQCHVRFDRAAQDRLCMNCHKDVARDVAARSGLHGRQKAQACRTCHTDHKGRDARIVSIDTAHFDHATTDYTLRGAHLKATCASCHPPAKKYRDAPQECDACHRKDDAHKGALGARCADCHTETRWREARFDHDKTRFALTGRHVEAKCADCHRDGHYKDTPRACVACHRQDDNAKGHHGQFGERCESCHGTREWKPSTFNHDNDTHFVLRGKHHSVRCTSCHTEPLFKVKTPTACFDCHRKDDKHQQTLGRDCASCHTEQSWKEKARFDHAKTAFPLLGKHATADCKSCHRSTLFKEAPSECIACHRKDDKHAGNLGDACASCHQARDWKSTQGRFDHDRTHMPLRNAHARPTLACSACHRDLRSMRGTPADCVSCHRKEDKHEGQLGRQCEQCHGDREWKSVTRFDHARTPFPLVGRHLVVACKSCHQTQRFKDAPSDCFSCHRKDDRHALKYGTRCESCHTVRGWALWEFDHERRSGFALDGAHRPLACERCHRQPAPPGKPIAELGKSCVACHRKDDTHDGGFGTRCEQCHSTQSWKRLRRNKEAG